MDFFSVLKFEWKFVTSCTTSIHGLGHWVLTSPACGSGSLIKILPGILYSSVL